MHSLFKDQKTLPKVITIQSSKKIKAPLIFKPGKLNKLLNLKSDNNNFIPFSRDPKQKNTVRLNKKQKTNKPKFIYDSYLENLIKKMNKNLLDKYKNPYIKNLLNKKPFNISSIKESDKPKYFYYFQPCYILEHKKCALTSRYNDCLLCYNKQEYLINYYKGSDAIIILKYLLYVHYNLDPYIYNKFQKCNIYEKTQYIISKYNEIILTNNNNLHNNIKPILPKKIKYFYIEEIPKQKISRLIPNYYVQGAEILSVLENFIKNRKFIKLSNNLDQEKLKKKEKNNQKEKENIKIKKNENDENNNSENNNSINGNCFINSLLSNSSSNTNKVQEIFSKDNNKLNYNLYKRIQKDKEIFEIEQIIGNIVKGDEKKQKKIKEQSNLTNRTFYSSKTNNNKLFISSINHPIAIKKKSKDIFKNKIYSYKESYFNKNNTPKNNKKSFIKYINENEKLNRVHENKKTFTSYFGFFNDDNKEPLYETEKKSRTKIIKLNTNKKLTDNIQMKLKIKPEKQSNLFSNKNSKPHSKDNSISSKKSKHKYLSTDITFSYHKKDHSFKSIKKFMKGIKQKQENEMFRKKLINKLRIFKKLCESNSLYKNKHINYSNEYNSFSGIQYLKYEEFDLKKSLNLRYSSNLLKKAKNKFEKDFFKLKNNTTLKQMIKYSDIYTDHT